MMVHMMMHHHLLFSACDRRHRERNRNQRGQHIRKIFHGIPLALLVHADAGTK
jgi:hypothetical protein